MKKGFLSFELVFISLREREREKKEWGEKQISIRIINTEHGKKSWKSRAYSSQRSISLAIKFLRQSDHAFEQESILHFVLRPPPRVHYAFRHVHYYPIYRAERRGDGQTDGETEREWRKITNERVGGESKGEKGRWKAVAYNFSSLPFFLQKSVRIAARTLLHVERGYLWGLIFGGPDLCAPNPADVFTFASEKIYRRPSPGWKRSRNVCRPTSKTIPLALVPLSAPRSNREWTNGRNTCSVHDWILIRAVGYAR